MKRGTMALIGFFCAAAFLVSGCAMTGMNSKTGPGFLYTGHQESLTATSASGSKSGEACSSNILGLFTTGNSSVAAAKNAGGISKASSVDVKYSNILGLYGTACTVVRGN